MYVHYYDQGSAWDGDLTETTYQYSDDGGATWSRPAPLTDRPFHAGYGNDTGQPNIGDYNQTVAQNGELFAVWSGAPPLLGFADGQPSVTMTVPDVYFKRIPEASSRLPVALAYVFAGDSGLGPLGGNGFIDPGEDMFFSILLNNYVTNPSNAGTISGVSAVLSSTTPGVLVLEGSSSYADLAPDIATWNDFSYVVTTGPAFQPGTRIELVLTVTSAQDSTSLPFTQATGTPVATELLSQNFDGVAPGLLPAGWTTAHFGGSTTVPWTTSALSLGAAPAAISNAAFHANANDGSGGDHTRWERLFSPLFVVPPDAEYVIVEFDAAYNTEEDPDFNVQAYDGFLLRIADHTPGRTLRSVAVEAFAEEFTTDGWNFYPRHMPRGNNLNYLEDLSAWAGDSNGYQHVRLKLPVMAGSTAQLRFEYTQDNVWTCANLRPGHRCGVLIDNVVVNSIRSVTPTTLTLTATPNFSVAGQSIAFDATVTTSGGVFVTEGSVTFKEGSTVLAGPTPVSGSGQAGFSTSALGPGMHVITAEFTSASELLGDSSGSTAAFVVVSASIDDVSVPEGASGMQPAAVFTVSLSQASTDMVTIGFTTADGTATAGVDYVPTSGVLTFLPGEVTKPVSVSVIGDDTFEPTEDFYVFFTITVNAVSSDSLGVGTILNDDASVPVVNESTVLAAVTGGGTRLMDLQNPDGGWFFRVGQTDCNAGPGVSCPNTFGVTGLGLVAAYFRTGNTALLDAAEDAGDALVVRYNAAILQVPPKLPYSQDIEFLMELGSLTGNSVYWTTAESWFQLVIDRYPNPSDRVDALFTNRNAQGFRTVAVWDAASFIRAAKAVGEAEYAVGAAMRVRDREADWKDTNPLHRWDQCEDPLGCGPADNPLAFDFTLIGEGSLLWAIHDLPGFDTQINEYRSFLLAQQDPQGSWDAGDSQMTSYVVLGLAAVGGPGSEAAIESAAEFFLTNTLPAGGWPSYVAATGNGVENTEIDAEVTRAMATLFSTPAGSNVWVSPAQLSTLTFSNVTSAGITSVVAVAEATAPTVPGGFQVVGGLTYSVTTTASISGTIVVCFSVPWIDDPVTFDSVRILHGEGGVLVDRTILAPDAPAPDFATRRVCSLVTSLSPFAIALMDETPPSLSVSLTPSVLWPPDHRLTAITATIDVTDDTDAAPTVELVSITSSEAESGTGGGDVAGDISDAIPGTDDRAFRLRAERSGRGAGRVYTVVYRATDQSGRTSEATAQVVVPHNPPKATKR